MQTDTQRGNTHPEAYSKKQQHKKTYAIPTHSDHNQEICTLLFQSSVPSKQTCGCVKGNQQGWANAPPPRHWLGVHALHTWLEESILSASSVVVWQCRRHHPPAGSRGSWLANPAWEQYTTRNMQFCDENSLQSGIYGKAKQIPEWAAKRWGAPDFCISGHRTQTGMSVQILIGNIQEAT